MTVTTATATLTTSTTSSSTTTVGPFDGDYEATITVPAASAVAHLQFTVSLTLPTGLPTVMSARRLPKNVSAANINVFADVRYTQDVNVTLPDGILLSWQFAPNALPPDPTHSYIALYNPNDPVNPNNPTAGWTLITGAATQTASAPTATSPSGAVVFVWPPSIPLTLIAGTTYDTAFFSTTTTLSTPTPTPTTSPSPTVSPTATVSPVASPSAAPSFVVLVATAGNTGLVTIPFSTSGSGAFAVEAANNTDVAINSVTISSNVGVLPVTATICQTNPSGQCLAAPAQTVPASFAAGATATYAVFLTASAAIATPGTITIHFSQNNTVIASGSVQVNTN